LGSDFSINGVLPANALPCPVGSDCGTVSGNVATAADGAVFRMLELSFFGLNRTRVFNNQGAFLFRGFDAYTTLNNLLITNNTITDELFIDQGDAQFGGFFIASGLTIADNQIGGIAVFRIADQIASTACSCPSPASRPFRRAGRPSRSTVW
jgi:hypothetical protein